MTLTATTTPSRPASAYAWLLAIGMAVTIGTALAFQYIGGYVPCALCLEQRLPYYYGIPVAVLAAVSALVGLPSWITRVLLGVAGIMMLVGGGIGVYHAGVEWHFWEGPVTCASGGSTSATPKAGDLLGQLNTLKGPSCTEAALRVLGLSMAGWNVIASIVLAAIAFAGLRRS